MKTLLDYKDEYKNLLIKRNLKGEKALEAVKRSGYNLKYVKEQDQTPEICLAAIKQNVDALQYVRNQTAEICLTAVKKDGWALEHVRDQTPEICLAAVKQNLEVLQYVDSRFFKDITKEEKQ